MKIDITRLKWDIFDILYSLNKDRGRFLELKTIITKKIEEHYENSQELKNLNDYLNGNSELDLSKFIVKSIMPIYIYDEDDIIFTSISKSMPHKNDEGSIRIKGDSELYSVIENEITEYQELSKKLDEHIKRMKKFDFNKFDTTYDFIEEMKELFEITELDEQSLEYKVIDLSFQLIKNNSIKTTSILKRFKRFLRRFNVFW